MTKAPKFKLGDKVCVACLDAPHYKLIGEVINIVCFDDAIRVYQLSFDSPLVQDGPHWYSENHLVYVGNNDDGAVFKWSGGHVYANNKGGSNNDRRIFNKSKYDAKIQIFDDLKADFVEKIIVNGPKTIVFWNDGTKTIVSCREGEAFDIYTAFCAALAKKMFGSTSRTKAIMEDKLIIQEKKEKKKSDAAATGDLSAENILIKKSIQNIKAELVKSMQKIFGQMDQERMSEFLKTLEGDLEND